MGMVRTEHMMIPCGARLAGTGENGGQGSAAGVQDPVSLDRVSIEFEELLEILGGEGSALGFGNWGGDLRAFWENNLIPGEGMTCLRDKMERTEKEDLALK